MITIMDCLVTSMISRIYRKIRTDMIYAHYMNPGKEQCEFHAEISCKSLKQIIEEKEERNMETHLMFVDIQTTYDIQFLRYSRLTSIN